MKYYLAVLLATTMFFSCNQSNEKTEATDNKTKTDTVSIKDTTRDKVITDDHILSDSPIVDLTPVDDSRLIIPGKSIGRTTIDEKNKDVRKNLGEPNSDDAAMGKDLAIWYSKPKSKAEVKNETDICFATNMGGKDEESRVSHIRITSSFFITSEHVGTGSTLEMIQKYFPGIKKIANYTSKKTTVTIYDDAREGIAFEVDDKNLCLGITVRKPNSEAYQPYNVLFENIKFL